MKHKPTIVFEPTDTTLSNDAQAGLWRMRLKWIMEQRGISQRKLAEMAGLGPTSVRHAVTKNGTITIETLRRLSNALDTPISYLLTGHAVSMEVGGNDQTPQSGFVVPIHGQHEEPGLEHGRGSVFIERENREYIPYAMLIEDNSMQGIGSNYQPDPADVILSGDIVVWSIDDDFASGDVIIVKQPSFSLSDVAEESHPDHLCVRLLEQDGGEYFATALTRTFGRRPISTDDVLGKVCSVVRRRSI